MTAGRSRFSQWADATQGWAPNARTTMTGDGCCTIKMVMTWGFFMAVYLPHPCCHSWSGISEHETPRCSPEFLRKDRLESWTCTRSSKAQAEGWDGCCTGMWWDAGTRPKRLTMPCFLRYLGSINLAVMMWGFLKWWIPKSPCFNTNTKMVLWMTWGTTILGFLGHLHVWLLQ